MAKPHLYFKNPSEGVVSYKARQGGMGNSKEDDENEKNYVPIANAFKQYVSNYNRAIQHRIDNRSLIIDNHFDLIELTFHGSFQQEKYQTHYIQTFGLVPVRFTLFNKKVLFAIENRRRFNHFFQQLKNFIAKYTSGSHVDVDGKVKFIKSFKLFSSDAMYGDIDNYEVIHLSFIDHSFMETDFINPQKQQLIDFLNSNNINYSFNDIDGEIYNVTDEVLRTIFNNFDFIYASCSGSGAIIRPSIHNTPQRTYGFEITNSNEELPIIGIIDSGISNQTPLAQIIIGEENEFNTTNSSSFIDNANHGTGVAAFAAFSTKLIAANYQGDFEADAKVLPIKVIDNQTGSISQQKTIDLIRKAHNKYNVRIFTLTIGYTNFPLKDNAEYSSYARMLDELTAELDILIFISTTNNLININSEEDYPSKFKEHRSNIAPPAESMNNITIGSTADNYEGSTLEGLALDKDFPAIYSRKFHYNQSDKEAFSHATRNKYLRKPDILIGGGDYSEYNISGLTGYADDGSACLEVLSSNLSERTIKVLGTSYSTPIAANIAAKLLRRYPTINMQTVKALIVNSSKEINVGDSFEEFSKACKNRIFGYGTPDIESLLNSSDDKVTLIIEDEIIPGNIKVFPIHIPQYLNNAQRINGVLKVSSTLTFKFKPKVGNQLLYCPLHLTFAIGKNLVIEDSHEGETIDMETGEVKTKIIQDGYNGNSTKELRLCTTATGWVQDYYYINKIVSNVQKTNINVSKKNIIDENNTFKIAINSALHKQLTTADKNPYNDISIPYSLVITIEQITKRGESFDSLYDGLIAENTLEIITDVELEADLNN